MTATSIEDLNRWAQFYWPSRMGQLRVNDPGPLRAYHRSATALRAAAAALTTRRCSPDADVAFDMAEALAVAEEHWPAGRTRMSDRDRNRVSVSVARDHDVASALRAAVTELNA